MTRRSLAHIDGGHVAPLLNAGTYATPSRVFFSSLRHSGLKLKPHRLGEFTVDAGKFYDEFLKEPFHAAIGMPLSWLIVIYVLCYCLFILITAILFYIVSHLEDK